MIDPIDTQPNFPELEEKLVEHWKKNKIFEKSVALRPDDRKWTFLDGPPFITGMPHYGTLLSSLPKDVFPRFWTMKGYKVRRVWGWDCHGLPAENKVENKLGLKRKKDIEEVVGIKKFIDECKLYVGEVSGEWEWYIDHIARWVDFKNAYKTMDTDYMESVMWVFKQMYEKDYIYKGLRVSLYCPHCSTPISNFEVAMDSENYKDITDSGTIYKFRLKDEGSTYLLAWSTTPWTKITTSALAVNPELTYVYAQVADETYVLAESTLEILKADYKIVKKVKGSDLSGLEFEPHFNHYLIDEGKKAFIVVADNFVTADEGTGVVTLAPYGEDDLRVMKQQNIHIEMHLDDEGHMLEKVPQYGGMYYLKANKLINADLTEKNLVYRDEPYTHSMPHCWRCGTLLYYAPQDAWYVDIQKLKPQLFKNNERINWFPDHFKHGRFLKSMEAAPDWCISRSRYWGSPVPVWECECGTIFVPGSIDDLEKASGKKIAELHRPEIDDVIVKCADCGKDAHRVPEVLDSWIEAGSASFAERHFPFDKNIKLEDFFPPDFIVEYTGQIRAWFYVLHVIGTALFDSHSFKNVAVTGVILGTDGRKMSKNFGNYPDPRMMLEKYGGDALRLYLMGSPVMRGEDIIISEEDYRNQIKAFHIPLWNIFKFFLLYAKLDNYEIKDVEVEPGTENILDRWLVNLLHKLHIEVTKDLEAYDSVSAIKKLIQFVDDTSKWYVRRSRDRVGFAAHDAQDKQAFYDTMLYALREFSKISAPIVPFISENIFTYITKQESVHLQDWPNEQIVNGDLLENMDALMKLVETGHRVRKEKQLKVRQPLASITFTLPEKLGLKKDDDHDQYIDLIKDELNVKEVIFKEGEELSAEYDTVLTRALEEEGSARELVRKIQQQRRQENMHQHELVDVVLPEIPEEFVEYIKEKVMARNISKGESFSISKVSEK